MVGLVTDNTTNQLASSRFAWLYRHGFKHVLPGVHREGTLVFATCMALGTPQPDDGCNIVSKVDRLIFLGDTGVHNPGHGSDSSHILSNRSGEKFAHG